ncbi:MAG: putative DNA binding domain-containing protein [Candidatus Methanomethylophilaceae archaeon]|nr:putative DNA binding domain-containing protein [Candidatus Methanomethylophilaceae archaeon]
MAEFQILDGRIITPESITFELKKCEDKLSRDFWPTYSAFANTFGGTIILGIDDETREITGVKNPEKIIKDLWDLLNDPNKVNINLLADKDVQVRDIDGRTIIIVRVPRAERRKRPVFINGTMENGTYKRNGEGDYHCSSEELTSMLRERSDESSDSKVLNDVYMDSLDQNSVKEYRKLLTNRNPAHPWNKKDDTDFLRLIGAASKTIDGSMHPTAAGLLMFGYDAIILSEFPNYHLDYLEFADGSNNWTYRISTGTGEFTGNLFEFFTSVSSRLSFLNKKSKDLEGMVRNDDNQAIRAQRELLANAVMHADYLGLGGIRAEWSPSRFTIRNPGDLRIPLKKMFEGGMSDPRNPHIAVMMTMIGMAERAGSGVSSIVDCCKAMSIPLPEYIETSDPETVTVTLRLELRDSGDKIEDRILSLMKTDPSISVDKISQLLGMERNRTYRTIKKMADNGLVKRTGGTRGRWIVES